MLRSIGYDKNVLSEEDISYITGDNFTKWNYMKATDYLGKQFPYGQIILMDGRMIECYLRATKENNNRDNVSDEEIEKEANLFFRNAFHLLANKERILTDSRMFLCPVAIGRYLSIPGMGPNYPTLGIYLQWWDACVNAMRTDDKGRRSLVYHVIDIGAHFSPGKEVFEDGTTGTVIIDDFYQDWMLFTDINNAYCHAKQFYQAYSLQQVLDILEHEEEGDHDYAHTINEQFHVHEIKMLNERICYLDTQLKTLYKLYLDTKLKLKEDTIIHYYEDYKALEQQVTTEIEKLNQHRRDLRAALRRGEYTNKEYQPMVGEINRNISDQSRKLDKYKTEELQRVFHDEEFTFGMIEDYMQRYVRPNAE